MSNNNLIKQYKEQEIMTMSNGELLVKLYDELIKNLKYASVLLGQKNSEAARKCITKSRDIINYLLVLLDDQYPIAANLRKIYTIWLGKIIRASASGDASYLDLITPQAQELREAWAEAEKKVRKENGEKGQSL